MRIYEIVLSTKDRVTIDETDYDKLKSNSGTGNFVVLKMAVINPSFVVAILPKSREESEEIEGYLDEEKGVFVATKVSKKDSPLVPHFEPEIKSLANKFKV